MLAAVFHSQHGQSLLFGYYRKMAILPWKLLSLVFCSRIFKLFVEFFHLFRYK
jgi:hypothetical protein